MKYVYIDHGQAEVREWESQPSTEELQRIVGGYFEVYKLAGLSDHTLQLFVNEFGKPKGLTVNFFWEEMMDVVRGPAFVAAIDWDGEICGMTEADLAMISVSLPPGAKVLPRLEVTLT